MTRLPRSLLAGAGCGALLAGLLPAQYYWPAAAAGTRGNAVLNSPFSSPPGHATATTRCMVVLDPASLPFPVNTVLTRLSLRRDGGYPGQAYAGTSGILRVRIGAVSAPPDDVHDPRFDRLWSGAPTTVFSSSVSAPFAVPSAPAPGSSLPPWSVVIPFQANYTWTGGPIAIDFVFTPTSGSPTWRLDGFAVAEPQAGTGRPAGAGCQGSNGFTPFHYVLPGTALPGATMLVQLEGGRLPATPSALENFAVHLVGVQNASFQGQPLPLSLGGLGGPPACLLRVDPLLNTFTFCSNPSALFTRATATLSLPSHPLLIGALLYSQWLCFDGGMATPLALTVSDAQAITLGQIAPPIVPHAARTIWRYGATGYESDVGRLVPADYGPALRFN
jgi:hypothetical protein